MSAKVIQLNSGDYHYSMSGLNNIYLRNGVSHDVIDGEVCVSFVKIINLHKCISQTICTAEYRLVGEELKFLRKNRGISLNRMAIALGVDRALLESVEREPCYSFLESRVRAVCIAGEPLGYTDFLKRLDSLNDAERPDRLTFAYKDEQWRAV